MPFAVATLAAALVAAGAASNARAQYVWTGPPGPPGVVTGMWSDGANWVGGVAPPQGAGAGSWVSFPCCGSTSATGGPWLLNRADFEGYSSGSHQIAGGPLVLDGASSRITFLAPGGTGRLNPGSMLDFDLVVNTRVTFAATTGTASTFLLRDVSGPGGLDLASSGGILQVGFGGRATYLGATRVGSDVTLMLGADGIHGDASLAGAAVVDAGGAIQFGAASAVAGNVTIHGRLTALRDQMVTAPRIGGTLAFSPGGEYRVMMTRFPESRFPFNFLPPPAPPEFIVVPAKFGVGRVDVAGAAVLNQATLKVDTSNVGGGPAVAGGRYTVLSAAGGVSGTFTLGTASIQLDGATRFLGLAYDATSVYLDLLGTSPNLAGGGLTANQRGVGGYLDANSAAPNAELSTLLGTLSGLRPEQLATALEGLSGSSSAATVLGGRGLTAQFGRTLAGRLSGGGGGAGANAVRVALGESGRVTNDLGSTLAQLGAGGAVRGSADPGQGLWAMLQGVAGSTAGDANAPGSTLRGAGLVAGYDRLASDGRWLAGVALGETSGRFGVDGRSDRTIVDQTMLSVYGEYRPAPVVVSAMAGHVRERIDSLRGITLGATTSAAAADYRGSGWFARVDAGRDVDAGTYRVRPYAGVLWSRVDRDGYVERGAGIANLAVDGKAVESRTGMLGVKARRPVSESGAMLELRGAWTHEFGDVNPSITARLSGAGGAGTFTTAGAGVGRNALQAGGGVSGQMTRRLLLRVDYDVEARDGRGVHSLAASLRYEF